EVEIYQLDLEKGMTKAKLSQTFDLPMMMLASSQAKDAETGAETKDILNDYQALAADGKKAQQLGTAAKDLGEKAKAAGNKAQTATESGDLKTAQEQAEKAQELGEQAQEKGSQAKKLATTIKTTKDA